LLALLLWLHAPTTREISAPGTHHRPNLMFIGVCSKSSPNALTGNSSSAVP
jgi:hypothetical protein